MTKLTVLGCLLLALPPLVLVLLLMPVIPDLQRWDSVTVSYVLYTTRWVLFSTGLVAVVFSIIRPWTQSTRRRKIITISCGIISLLPMLLIPRFMSAERIFQAPTSFTFSPATTDDVDLRCMVVSIGSTRKAYPIDVIAYHHLIADHVETTPVLVTYCTMCHSGRVFSPVVDGVVEQFRLVGANQFNAMMEDGTTGSWWYQATGECIAGPRKGMQLKEIDFSHDPLTPTTLVYRPSPTDAPRLHAYKGFARRSDTSSVLTDRARVFAFRFRDSAYAIPHSVAFAYHGKGPWLPLHGTALVFQTDSTNGYVSLVDSTSGKLIQVYDEYWHSWRTFNPTTRILR
jgi:hypothetical protein